MKLKSLKRTRAFVTETLFFICSVQHLSEEKQPGFQNMVRSSGKQVVLMMIDFYAFPFESHEQSTKTARNESAKSLNG